MKIFVIIVTYNSIQWIDRCLNSLNNSTVPVIPVIVDNCSKDATREYIPARYPECIWLPQKHNLGFGQGNNVGIRYAIEQKADYILLLNQDAYLATDAIEIMLKQSDNNSLLSPIHFNGDMTAIDNGFRSNTLHKCRNLLYDDLILNKTTSRYEVDFINAACWFIPMTIIKRIGGFNPLFFHYCEDINFMQRMHYHGIKTYIVPGASVCHDRKVVGNIQAFQKGRVHREILAEACNINDSLIKRINKYIQILTIYRHQKLDVLKELFWIATPHWRIWYSRRKDKQEKQQWLSM